MQIHSKRSLIYALSITTGLIFLQNIRFITFGRLWFVVCAILILLVLITEFFFSYFHNVKIMKNHPIQDLAKKVHEHHSFQYIYLSLALFVLLSFFIYFNTLIFVNLFVALIAGVLFFFIFNEIRNSYLNEFQVSKNVPLTFDITKALLYFLGAYVFTYLFQGVSDGYLYVAAILFVFHLFNLFLSSHHERSLHSLPFLAIICSIAAAAAYVFLINSTKVNGLISVAGISGLMSLLTINIFHHQSEKTLNRDTIIEYLLLSLLVLILILS